MTTFRFILMGVMAVALVGCRAKVGPPTPPGTATFAADATPLQVGIGQKQTVEITTHYTHPANPPAPMTVSYSVQLTPPAGWTVEPARWEHSQGLKTTDIGFNEKRPVTITIPANATVGEHVLKLSVTPTSGPPQSLELKFQVIEKGK